MELKIKELPVKEANYEETMTNVVEPYLKSVGEDGFFDGFDGKPIHYERYLAEDPVGTVVIVHGFTESAEKFREMSYNFLQMGMNVFAIDNRGHGRSYRMNCFMTKVVLKVRPELPRYLYAHSMGGAISVQYLQTYPGAFSKAVLSSPMIKANTANLPHGVVLAISAPMVLLGKGNKKPGFMGGFDPNKTYKDSHDTSEARFNYYMKKRIADPALQTASPSYNWTKEAVLVTRKNLDPARCAKITVPVLLCQPEQDSAVIPEAEEQFVSLLPNGRLERFTDCKHEIYLSVDATVLEYLQTIESFLKNG